MQIRKLFQVLVAGGAILAGVSTGCGGSGNGQSPTTTGGTPDGGAPGGGGTHGW
jgi:hypothetical protein